VEYRVIPFGYDPERVSEAKVSEVKIDVGELVKRVRAIAVLSQKQTTRGQKEAARVREAATKRAATAKTEKEKASWLAKAAIAEQAAEADDPLAKIVALVAEIEARRSKCRQCGTEYFRRKFRDEAEGFCSDRHRAEWHNGERTTATKHRNEA